MPATPKRQQPWKTKLTPGKQYPIDDALKLVKEFATAKFAEAVDVAVNLGIDASKSDQQVRGSTVLPHGIGKSVRVAVFTSGKNQEAARAAGADIVGLEDLAEKVKAGQFDFDVVIASPDAMRVVGQLGQILGPAIVSLLFQSMGGLAPALILAASTLILSAVSLKRDAK